MYGSHSPDQWLTVDRYYLPGGIKLLQYFDGTTVIGIAKNGRKHHLVRNVKICVASWKAIQISILRTCAADRARHWQRNHVEWPPIRVSHHF